MCIEKIYIVVNNVSMTRVGTMAELMRQIKITPEIFNSKLEFLKYNYNREVDSRLHHYFTIIQKIKNKNIYIKKKNV